MPCTLYRTYDSVFPVIVHQDYITEEEFHSALNEVNKRWPTLHNNAKHFLSYFVKGPADVIKDSMRADIRSMCGLGFPPTTYSQNASECLNRYVKENAKGSEDVTSPLVEVLKNISSVVKRQIKMISRLPWLRAMFFCWKASCSRHFAQWRLFVRCC